ncbi:MAG: hypothetical protein IH600_14780 [Bacteroidetes bacterium]|nr:hypothetical protein [Bacteroidota bacterium]
MRVLHNFILHATGPEFSFRSRIGVLSLLISVLFGTNAAAQDLSSENVRPFTLTGTLVTAGEHYKIPGLDTRRPENSARLYFNPTLSIYGLQLPFSFLLSTQERNYNQPFNQFGVSPTYRWLTLHGGYRSLRFSEFTLSDAVFLGGGAEAQGDLFRFRGMYGRLRRSVDEDTVNGIRAVYKRMGWAVGGGIGDKETYLDLNILHAWDDSTSLSTPQTIANVRPAENVVGGLNGRLPLDNGRIVFDAEFAASFVTRDTDQPEVKNEDVLDPLLTETRYSSRLNYAWRSGATYNADLWSLRLEYARVEPEYETMGAIYTQNDYEDISIKPQFHLSDGSLRAGGSIGWRHDNLFDDRQFTTNRVIGSATVNWMPDPVFNIDGNYSNYSMSSAAGSIPVNDSTRLDNVSESWSLSPRLSITGMTTQHFLMLLLTKQIFSDENLLTGAMSDNDVFTAVLSYTLGFSSGYGFSGSFLFTEVQTVFLTNIVRGFTVEANRGFFDNTLNTSLSYAINLTRASSESETDTQHLVTLSARYRFSRADNLEFRYQFNKYHAVNPMRNSYDGSVIRVQYSRAFSFGTD